MDRELHTADRSLLLTSDSIGEANEARDIATEGWMAE